MVIWEAPFVLECDCRGVAVERGVQAGRVYRNAHMPCAP